MSPAGGSWRPQASGTATAPGRATRHIAPYLGPHRAATGQWLREMAANLDRPVPDALRARHRDLSPEGEADLRDALALGYFASFRARWGADYLQTDAGRTEMREQLFGRLEVDRETVIPWLSSLRSLDGARILEIGCGTGASTIALAEQGARVTAVDASLRNVRIAARRAEIYSVEVEHLCATPHEVADLVRGESHDIVIFCAPRVVSIVNVDRKIRHHPDLLFPRKAKTGGAPAQKAMAYVEEGRLLVLEMMGLLLSHYRNLSVGLQSEKDE